MESKEFIQYKLKNGVYKLEDIVKMVRDQIITKEQFFDITGYNFDGVTEVRGL